jgi:hypothetical protein
MPHMITNELIDGGPNNLDALQNPHVWTSDEITQTAIVTVLTVAGTAALAYVLWKNRQAIRNAVTTIHPRWITLAARGLIGAAVLVCVGYIGDAASHEAISFGYWITAPIRNGVFTWAAAGAALGVLTLLAGRTKV